LKIERPSCRKTIRDASARLPEFSGVPIKLTCSMSSSKSEVMFHRASRVFPAGVSYGARGWKPYPFYVARASGSKLIDIDGNEYTDFWCTHLSAILGHCYPKVVEAVKKQAEMGLNYGLEHELEIEHAELIKKHMPSVEMMRFTSSGTEANMYAIRLARTFTKRTMVAKFEGNWHGGYDGLHYAIKPPLDKAPSGGLTPGVLRDLLVLPYNDLDQTRRKIIEKKLACVEIEPVMGAGGMVPADREFLKGLREICDETGTLLIFDEVITGFRLGIGGAQSYYGVRPDLTVLGKIIGGGLPVGAVGGRYDVLEHMDHNKYRGEDYSFHGGTGSANALTIAAGYATIKVLESNPVYDHIDKLGDYMRSNLSSIFDRYEYEAQVTGVGSMLAIHFTREPVKDVKVLGRENREKAKQFFAHQLSRGNLILNPELPHTGLSYAHTQKEIEQFVKESEEFVKNATR
jgi:glutamate-1-semialdehyde 2,1-aminomutase